MSSSGLIGHFCPCQPTVPPRGAAVTHLVQQQERRGDPPCWGGHFCSHLLGQRPATSPQATCSPEGRGGAVWPVAGCPVTAGREWVSVDSGVFCFTPSSRTFQMKQAFNIKTKPWRFWEKTHVNCLQYRSEIRPFSKTAEAEMMKELLFVHSH